MSSGVTRVAVGGYVGTGVLQEIKGEKIDFVPKKIEIHRMETALDKVEWIEGMEQGCGIKTPGAGGARVALGTNGISQLAYSGFSVGTDASVNTNGELYRYVAHE